MNFFANLLTWLSPFIALCVTIGGLFAIKQGHSKQASELEGKTIETQKTLIEAQERQIESKDKEIALQKGIVKTLQYTLRRRNLRIRINSDSITLIDETTRNEYTVEIRMSDKHDEDDLFDIKQGKPMS